MGGHEITVRAARAIEQGVRLGLAAAHHGLTVSEAMHVICNAHREEPWNIAPSQVTEGINALLMLPAGEWKTYGRP